MTSTSRNRLSATRNAIGHATCDVRHAYELMTKLCSVCGGKTYTYAVYTDVVRQARGGLLGTRVYDVVRAFAKVVSWRERTYTHTHAQAARPAQRQLSPVPCTYRSCSGARAWVPESGLVTRRLDEGGGCTVQRRVSVLRCIRLHCITKHAHRGVR